MEETLTAHNTHRAREGKPPLKWCEDCARAAREWADVLATQNRFEHGNTATREHGQMGQNLVMGGKNMSVSKAVDIWMSEKDKYNPNLNTHQPGCGHYTQVVWKSTTHVGAAVASVGNKRIVVANYHHAGNAPGQFKHNV